MLELAEARRLADAEDAPPEGCARLDAATIADLDLPLVYRAIDRTVTPTGGQALWRWLAAPALDPAVLAARERRLGLLADPAARTRLRKALTAGAAWGDAPFLPRLLWEPPITPPRARWFVLLLGALLALLAAAVLWPSTGWGFGAMALFAGNVLLDDWLNLRLAQQARALEVLGHVLATAQRLVRRKLLPAPLAAELAAELAPVAALRKRIRILAVRDPLDLASVVRAGFLIRLIALARCLHVVDRERARLRRLVLWMGELDVLLSIHALRAERPHRIPELDITTTITASDVVHPGVANAIGNDLVLDQRSLLVTGSNMSGKSTFLRAIGITAILAQSIHTTFGAWRAPPLRVFAAMRISDDTASGTSQYAAEVAALGRLVAAVGQTPPALFVVDEPFHGTNPAIRVPIVVHVLEYLAAHDLVVAATHDLEVAARLGPRFERGYFCELADQTFDRKLRPGVAPSHNAVALLARAGYPADLVKAIAVNIENSASSKAS